MSPFSVRGESITLGQFLKATGVIGSGGSARQYLSESVIRVNGVVENRRGRKLVPGDRVELHEGEWNLVRSGSIIGGEDELAPRRARSRSNAEEESQPPDSGDLKHEWSPRRKPRAPAKAAVEGPKQKPAAAVTGRRGPRQAGVRKPGPGRAFSRQKRDETPKPPTQSRTKEARPGPHARRAATAAPKPPDETAPKPVAPRTAAPRTGGSNPAAPRAGGTKSMGAKPIGSKPNESRPVRRRGPDRGEDGGRPPAPRRGSSREQPQGPARSRRGSSRKSRNA